MPRPNFFIVGAPKCGTTSLYETLRVHPSVFMPEGVKEPHYFARDLTTYAPPWRVRDEASYLALFEGADDASAVGEASVWYLFSATAAEEIHAFDPDARVIAMLRDPVRAMHAMHWEAMKGGNEDILDFREAIAAQAERARGERIPRSSHSEHVLQYERVFDYEPQVRRYLETFGPERVLVLVFEELVGAPAAGLARVADFLGIDPAGLGELARINPAPPLRNLGLRRFLKRRAGLKKALSRLPRPVRMGVGDVVQKFTGGKVTRPELPEDLRRELEGRAAAGVVALQELLGRDLGAWWGTARAAAGEPAAAG